MGTSLTGLTPATTYDALIKVGDNGPLSATAKVLSDGLGNDSVLALSTTSVGIGTATPTQKLSIADSGATGVSIASSASQAFMNFTSVNTAGFEPFIGFGGTSAGDQSQMIGIVNGGVRWTTAGAERMRITSAGNVGIGTSSPASKLDVRGSESGASPSALLRIGNTGAGNTARIILTDDTTADGNIVFKGSASSSASQYIGLGISAFDVVKITGDNYLRMASGTGGIQFNGDTAAANALDDYEEGTFTATLTGGISNPTTAVTTTANYTKIGRQVTVSIMFANVNTTGASGAVRITGLPFSCAIDGTGSVTCELFTFGASRTSVNAYVGSSAPTTVNLFVSGNDTSFENLSHNAGAGRYLYTSLTYFV